MEIYSVEMLTRISIDHLFDWTLHNLVEILACFLRTCMFDACCHKFMDKVETAQTLLESYLFYYDDSRFRVKGFRTKLWFVQSGMANRLGALAEL